MSGELDQIFRLLYFNKTNVEKLIQADVPHVFKNKYGEYKPGDYLFIACEHNYIEIVEHLLKLGADSKKPFNLNMTPLLVACQKGNLEVWKLLYKMKTIM